MDSKLIDNARQTLEAERARIRLELSEEVEHPRVAHGAQTAAATEVSESQRGQQICGSYSGSRYFSGSSSKSSLQPRLQK